jgi:hypothetical protein
MVNGISVPPFPAHLDREAFGHWLSGFADGESTFLLGFVRPKKRTSETAHGTFRITLRADDGDTLRLIQSFWRCGRLGFYDNRRSKIPNARPIGVYGVQATGDLIRTVIPHFDRYPLRSKKARDFAIWKEGIALLDTIQRRRLRYRPGMAPNRHGGTYPKWTKTDQSRFVALKESLQKQRAFDHLSPLSNCSDCTAAPIVERSLFDDCPD